MSALESRPRWRGIVIPYVAGRWDWRTQVYAPLLPEQVKSIEDLMGGPDMVSYCNDNRLCEVCGEVAEDTPLKLADGLNGLTAANLEIALDYAYLHPECAELALVQCPMLRAKRDWIRLASA